MVGYDNLATGQIDFLAEANRERGFTFIEGDVLDARTLSETMAGADIVFHLAANADVRFGLQHPRKDLEQNTIATFNVLEAMRANSIRDIAFSSTGSVYGEASMIPTPEDAAFPIQTSLYGASKLAGEGLIAAYCEGYGMRGFIFRFVSILGERYTHGHVFDFYASFSPIRTACHVLGDGHQRKSYLYVQDCIDAIFTAISKAQDKVNIFNLGTEAYCEVNDSVGWITGHLGLSPRLSIPVASAAGSATIRSSISTRQRIRALGWLPKLTFATVSCAR